MVPLSFGIGAADPRRPGDGRRQSAARAVRGLVGTGMCIAFGVLSAPVHRPVPLADRAMYTSDPAVQATCVHLLLFAALFQLSDSTQVAAASACAATR
jgi:MATE family multidrug resistance protein